MAICGRGGLGLTHSSYLKVWVWRPQTFMEAERSVRPRLKSVRSDESRKEHTEVMAMKCQLCDREAVIGGCCLRCDKIVGDAELEMKEIALEEMQGEEEVGKGWVVCRDVVTRPRAESTALRAARWAPVAPMKRLSARRARRSIAPAYRPGVGWYRGVEEMEIGVEGMGCCV